MASDQNSIRAVHIFQQSSGDSVISAVKNLNDMLQSRGVDSSIIYLDDSGVFRHLNENQEVTICRRDKKSGLNLGLVLKLSRYFKLKKIQFIHIHDIQLLPVMNSAAVLAGIKSFVTIRDVKNDGIKKFWFSRNAGVIFTSAYVRDKFLRHTKISSKKCSVIKDGFNIASFLEGQHQQKISADELRKKAGISHDHFVLCNMGGLLANQDQVSLLKAFRKLAKKTPNMILLIVGNGPLKSDLENIIEEFALKGKVILVPQDDNADAWMEICHLFVLSANVENYSEYILKAFAHSKPVIATKIGSQAELIHEDVGFLVPCGFPERMESAVMRLYANQAMIKKMGDKAREYLTEKLSADHTAAEHIQIYRLFLK